MRLHTKSIFVSIGVLALFVPGMVRAATSDPNAGISTPYSLTTSPVNVSLSGAPGSTQSTEMRVRNDSAETQRIKLTLSKFASEGEEGKPVILDRGTGDDYFDWAKFSPSEFDLAAGQWQTIKFSVTMPASAVGGYYYALRFSRIGDNISIPGKQVYAGSNVVLVLLDARAPGSKRSLTAESFASKSGLYEFLPARFITKLHNDGNVHVAPAGNIFITQGNKNIATLDFNAAGGNVLPDSKRIFEVDWKDGFPYYDTKKDEAGKDILGKDGKPIRTLTWNFSQLQKIRFGEFTAHLVAVYQDNNGRDIPIETTIKFWVIPWRIIGVFLLLAVFVPIGVYATGRGIWSRARKQRN